MTENPTIVAISTPIGTGGIGIVRISGAQAIPVAQRVFRSNSGKRLPEAAGYTGMLGRVFDAAGELDDTIAFLYRAPFSYTGEDVVELSCHGGSWIVQRVLRLCLEAGALPAPPGEFTKRAFLNGKLRLDEAEAVVQLIEAQGDAAMRAALTARDGALSTATEQAVEKLLAQSAHLAAWADYPEEEMEAVESDVLAAALCEYRENLQKLLGTYDNGRILREGIRTVIVGRPNVGKSTLMNLLSGTERSIVTAIPGTTRDVVEDSIRLGDCMLHLADTAGLREARDEVEQIGVQRSLDRLQEADLVLAVFDSSDQLQEEDIRLLERLADKPCIGVVNKIDLPPRLDVEQLRACIERIVPVSAQSGQGREQLEREVTELFSMTDFDPSAAMVSTERQRICLEQAVAALQETIESIRQGMTLDAVSVSLDEALDALLRLSGRRVTEAVVDEVFARFCVGK